MFGRSDSISEDVEFTYEEEGGEQPAVAPAISVATKPKKNFVSLSPSVSLLSKLFSF